MGSVCGSPSICGSSDSAPHPKTLSEKLRRGSTGEKLKLAVLPIKVVGSFLLAPFRRLLHPPLRSSWNPRFETYVHLVRNILLDAPNDLAAARALADRSVPNLILPRGVHRFKERVHVDLNGVNSVDGQVATHIKCEWLWPGQHTPGIPRKRLVEQLPGGFAESITDNRPVILYLHGGAFSLCSTGSYRGLLMQLSLTCDCAVYAPNYRRPPETPLAHAVQDVLCVLHRLETVYNVPRGRIVLAGDSAGGALALLTLLELKRRQEPQFAAAVLLSPWVDLSAPGDAENEAFDYVPVSRIPVFAHLAAGDSELTDPLVSATFADLAGLPPLSVQAGEVEVLLPQISEFVDKARKAGNSVEFTIYPDMVHAFHVFAFCHDTAMQGIRDIRHVVDQVGKDWTSTLH